MKAGLGLSLVCLDNCQYVVSHRWGKSYGEVAGDEAVATVACVLWLAGFFRTNAMPAAAGEEENDCVLHLDFCLRARTAFLAGYDRSMLGVRVESARRKRGVKE